jgi:GTP cyclohydrolase IA
MATSVDSDLSHGTLLSDSLQRLASSGDVALNGTDNDIDPHISSPPSRVLSSVLHEGYGFRPASGSSTPVSDAARNVGSPLPDPNGLGWPGEFFKVVNHDLKIIHVPAKSTVSRLTASPAEKEARQQKLCAAVRVILECIGEDPDREGLSRTPERYAQALMWMTKGYEERLAGGAAFCIVSIPRLSSFPNDRCYQ